MFRTSGRIRPKWDEKHGTSTYGQITIDKALQMVTGQYTPSKRGKEGNGSVSSPAAPPPSPRGLPVIVLGDVQLSDLTTQGLGAINRANVSPVVFVRTGSLCRVIRDEDGQPILDRIDKIKIRAHLAEVAEFYAINKRGNYIGASHRANAGSGGSPAAL